MDLSLVPLYTFIIFLQLINFSFILIASYFPFFPSIYYILLFYFQLLPSFPAETRVAFCQGSQLDISQSAEMLRLLAAILTDTVSSLLAFSLSSSSVCLSPATVPYLDKKLFSQRFLSLHSICQGLIHCKNSMTWSFKWMLRGGKAVTAPEGTTLQLQHTEWPCWDHFSLRKAEQLKALLSCFQ